MVTVPTAVDHEPRLNQLSISCMLNTEVGAILAVIRRPIDPTIVASAILLDDHLVQSLKSLRAIIFHTDWHITDPAVYLSPFLDVIQSDDVPAAATGAALSAVLKILQFGVFDNQSPGAFDAVHLIVSAITSCRLERTDPSTEDAILMRVLQVLLALLRCPAGRLLTDHAICTIVNTCFQVFYFSIAYNINSSIAYGNRIFIFLQIGIGCATISKPRRPSPASCTPCDARDNTDNIFAPPRNKSP